MALGVTELEIENFQRISFLQVPFRNGITELSGPNGAGKTSAINAVAVWLDGLKVAPAEPIRKGAERARIRGRLGEMYVTRTIGRDKKGAHVTEIKFEPVGGKAYPATQKQLHDLIEEHDLDPLRFLTLDAKGKFDAMRAFVPGFDFEKASNEQKADFSRRTDVNRLAREAAAAAALISIPEGTPDEPIDEQAIITELQTAGAFNTELEARKARRAEVARQIEAHRAEATTATDSLADVRPQMLAAHKRQVDQDQQRIAELEQQIAVIRARIVDAEVSMETAIQAEESRLREVAAASTEAAEALQKKLDEAGELPIRKDTDEIRARITQARTINQHVARAAERNRHLSTAKRYEAEAAELTAMMEARESAKQKAIAGAQLPVDGIEFGDGEIRYHGVPFDQASTAQKLTVGIARICALQPKLKLAWIRDASLLDDECYALLQKLAEQHQMTILLETVRPIGSDAVILQDGRAKADESATAMEATA